MIPMSGNWRKTEKLKYFCFIWRWKFILMSHLSGNDQISRFFTAESRTNCGSQFRRHVAGHGTRKPGDLRIWLVSCWLSLFAIGPFLRQSAYLASDWSVDLFRFRRLSAYFRCSPSRWDNRNRSTAAPVRRPPHSSSRNYHNNGRFWHAERTRHRKRRRRGRRSRRCLFGSARKRNRRDWKRRRLQHPGQRRSPLVADGLQRWVQSTTTPILHFHL